MTYAKCIKKEVFERVSLLTTFLHLWCKRIESYDGTCDQKRNVQKIGNIVAKGVERRWQISILPFSVAYYTLFTIFTSSFMFFTTLLLGFFWLNAKLFFLARRELTPAIIHGKWNYAQNTKAVCYVPTHFRVVVKATV
jgi:hypothetical protein